MKNNPLHTVHSGKYTLPAGIALFFILLLINGLYYSPGPAEEVTGLFCTRVSDWISSRWISFLLYQCILVAEAFLLVRLCDVYSLLYSRTPLIFLMYILLGNLNPRLFGRFDAALLVSLLFIAALFALFGSYQQQKSQESGFITGLLISAGMLIWPPFLYFLPVFWWGHYLMRSLHFRTVLASVLGIAAPVWLIYSFHLVAVFPVCTEIWRNELFSLRFSENEIWINRDFLSVLPAVFFGLVTVALNLFNDYQDKVRTLVSSRFFYLTTFISVFMIVMGTSLGEAALLLNICITYQGARYLVHARNRFSVYFLCFMGITYILSYIWILSQD